jgi:hypothetical protein
MVVLAGFCTAAVAGTTSHTYYFEQPGIEIINGQTTVVMNGAPIWGRVGEPLLPHAPLTLLLPPGEESVSLRVVMAEPVVLGDGYRIPHRQEPYPLSQGPSPELTPPNAAVYGNDDPYPAVVVYDLETHYLSGHSIADAAICPVVYRPASGQLSYYPWIEVTVESEPTPRGQQTHAQMLQRTRNVLERVEATVQNPEMSSVYGAQIPTDPDYWNMLFVMGSNQVDDYQEYVDYKNRSGIRSTIETVEDIFVNYSGDDFQEKIRACIYDYYVNHAISYVLLCGDTDYIACRSLWVQAGSSADNLPSDHYYAALDGTWNDDGDDYWGEPGEEDWYAEVTLGRSCADDASEVDNVLNKFMLYQTAPVADEIESALMVGEDLGWNSWGWEYMDEIHLGSSNHGYTTAGIPGNITVETCYEYPGISWSAMNDLLPMLNQGPNMVHHLGHANWNYVLKFYGSQVNDDNFTNNGLNHNFFIGYSQGCICGAFEHNTPDCIVEKFTTIANGAVAFIGNSRYGWGEYNSTNGASQRFHREFGDALSGEGITLIGAMNRDSKDDNVYVSMYDNYLRWCFYELNLFGDPTLDVWTALPGVFNPTYEPEVALGEYTFEVSDISVEGAVVTMSMDNVVLGQSIVNGSGVATVYFAAPLQQTGILDLMITAHDMLPYEGSVTVTGSGGSVSVALTPVNPPVQVPASGGSFDFNIEVANAQQTGTNFTAWCDVTLPDAQIYGPVIGPLNLYLSGSGSLNRDRTQSVPASAPAGTYSFNAYAVADGDTSTDSFGFEKLSAGDDGSLIGDWLNSGESFEEWAASGETVTPAEFVLHGAYPNPFNPATTLSFALPEAGHVNLTVYDVSGRQVAELADGYRDAGAHEVAFDGSALSSGVYIYRLSAGTYSANGKMILMK